MPDPKPLYFLQIKQSQIKRLLYGFSDQDIFYLLMHRPKHKSFHLLKDKKYSKCTIKLNFSAIIYIAI